MYPKDTRRAILRIQHWFEPVPEVTAGKRRLVPQIPYSHTGRHGMIAAGLVRPELAVERLTDLHFFTRKGVVPWMRCP